jgi:Flp pilus assembly protein TadG
MRTRHKRARRDGIATLELAFLAPFLAFIFVAAVDYGRIFYYSLTIENCARQGALYASDPVVASQSTYSSISAAALADASNLSPTPTVSSSSGTDSSNRSYVDVTVTYTFTTLTNYPGIPSSTTISRTVRVDVAPTVPQ